MQVAEGCSDRPEQAAWWAETERLFDGDVTFHDTEDVHIMSHGDLDQAHFVQVMEGHVTDRTRASELAESRRVADQAGTAPNSSPPASATAKENSTTPGSTATSSSRGTGPPAPTSAESTSTPKPATRPMAPNSGGIGLKPHAPEPQS